MKYSLIVLIEDDYPDIVDHIQKLHLTIDKRRAPFEMILVGNGNPDLLNHILDKIEIPDNVITAMAFNKRNTPAVCLKSACKESCGDIIVVTSGYPQITYTSLEMLIDRVEAGADIACPWRMRRVDSKFNQAQSKAFNYLIRISTKSSYHDLSCMVKVFRRDILNEIQIYGNLYRFLPILAEQKGFKVAEIRSEHNEQRGKSGYHGFWRYFTAIIDILTLYFNTFYSRKPLRFFSLIGCFFILLGALILLWVFSQKIIFNIPMGGRFEVFLAFLFSILGVQVAGVGLLGEIIAFTQGRQHKEYTIDKII